MRALPLLMSLIGVTFVSNAAPLGGASSTSSLWPLAASLGARQAVARVEVFSSTTVKKRPPLRILEQEIFPGARWRPERLGTGIAYQARRGTRFGRIAYVPVQGALTLVCATGRTVAAAAIDGALAAAPTPPCGLRQEQVTLYASLPRRPTAGAVRGALRRLGAVERGLVHGPAGLLALAQLPGDGPMVAIGGVPMNLAVEITYDNAHGARAVLATPTLPGSGP